MHAHDGHHRRPGREVLTHGRLTLDHGAFDRRGDHGVGDLLARELHLRAPLQQHSLAVLDLLERVLVPALGHLKGRDRGVELRPGDELPLPELRHPVALELGLVELRLRLTHHRSLGEVHAVVVAVGRKTEPDARLLERGDRLIQAVLVVLRVDARDGLALLDETAEVDGDLGEPSDDLRAQDDLLVGRQGPGGAHGARDGRLRGRNDPNRARGGTGDPDSVFFGDAVAGTSC